MTRVRPAREPNLILNRAGEDANGRREDAEADDRDGVATEVARVRREEGRGAGNSSDGGLNRRLNHRRRGDRTRDLGRGRCDIKKKTEKTGVRNRMEAKRAVRRVQKLLLFFLQPPQAAAARDRNHAEGRIGLVQALTTQRGAVGDEAAGDGERAGEEEQRIARHDSARE